ncbi:hypothetical protein SAMN03159338_1552 [Sphingomonas sp. NFR04]|uniref:hypothetical protein n=1 Tax=Sphingomonas sp. NFR04 TaxID=1566283 RepID=UPI0008EA573C|nr:hypothetical protein [Sphingomonas sp. NFR04]SFJ49255.1 hypothetical protein SAMN03159338_1552 [Sphingomonas sp. NFR04]
MAKTHKLTLSRDALMKAIAQVVKDTSVGLADLDCVAIHAVLVDHGKGAQRETFPLDTIEVELARPVSTPVRKVGKISLATVDGARV